MLKIINGTIHTMDPLNPHPEALVVENDRIIDSGTRDSIEKRYPGGSILDLKGRTLLPGFNDSHLHLLGVGMLLEQVDLSHVDSIEALQKELLAHDGQGPVIVGHGWNQDHLREGRMPTREDLDATGITKPIILHRTCVHMLVANSIAMEKAGVYEESGLFKESMMKPLKDLVPPPDRATIENLILRASTTLLSHGVTSVQSDDLFMVDETLHATVFEVYETLEKENRLPLRVYEQSNFGHFQGYMTRVPGYHQDRVSNRRFRRGPIKVLGDGSLGGRTAKLKAPYADDPEAEGILNFTREEIHRIFDLCDRHHLDVAVHAIGDEMLQIALDALEPLSDKDSRHSIIHCQITDPETLAALERIKPVVHIQPGFLNGDLHMAPLRLGPLRSKDAYNYRTLQDLGLNMAFGTDAPVESTNPFFGIYHAVTRRDREGNPPEGWMMDEAISIGEAIRHYTVDSAYASYEEDRKGLLKAGYLADFILVDQDPFKVNPERIKDIRVLQTYLDGHLVYDAG